MSALVPELVLQNQAILGRDTPEDLMDNLVSWWQMTTEEQKRVKRQLVLQLLNDKITMYPPKLSNVGEQGDNG